MSANIAVLVSGGGTNLQALIDAEAAGRLPHGHIALVISTRPDACALSRAAAAGIPAVTVARRAYPTGAAYEAALAAAIDGAGARLVILAGFLRILSPEFAARYEGRMINVHPSLIPSFCGRGMYGLRVHEAALERGVRVTGATVHLVTGEPDGGPILLQKAVAVHEGDTAEALQRRVMEEAEWQLLPEAAELICSHLTEVSDD